MGHSQYALMRNTINSSHLIGDIPVIIHCKGAVANLGLCGCAWPLCKFSRSEELARTVLLAQTWYRGYLDRCAFFLYPGYFIIALPVLPPCHKNYKPTGLIEKDFLRRTHHPVNHPPDGVKCKILPNFTLAGQLTVCWPVL